MKEDADSSLPLQAIFEKPGPCLDGLAEVG